MATELPPARVGAGGSPDSGGAGGALTRKIGPLPAWGWGVVVAGAVLVARKLGGKGATGGQSVPGTVPVGDVGDGGAGTGDTVVPGSAGPPGPQGAPGTLPTGYSSTLNQLLDWFQQLDRTTRLISQLRTSIANTHDTTKKKKLQAALDKATGKTVVSGGKFSYGGHNYYQQSWLNNIINELQKKLGALK
jgi:hypothetical protein